jgi:hypothetical protein
MTQSGETRKSASNNPYEHLSEAEFTAPPEVLAPLDPPAPIDPMLAGFIASIASGAVVGGVATFLFRGFMVAPAGFFGGIVASLIVGSVSFGIAGAISRKVGTDLASLLTSALAGAAAGWTVASFLGLHLIGRVLAAAFCAAVVLTTVSRYVNKQSAADIA